MIRNCAGVCMCMCVGVSVCVRVRACVGVGVCLRGGSSPSKYKEIHANQEQHCGKSCLPDLSIFTIWADLLECKAPQ